MRPYYDRCTFCLLVFLLLFSWSNLKSQYDQPLHINSVKAAESDYLLLMQPNSLIKQDQLTNELILDLVEVMVTDAEIGDQYERHRFIGGRVIRLLGWNWKPINGMKEKFVGTAIKHVRIPADEFLTEYDINWDLSSRLSKYFQLAYDARQTQIQLDQRMKKVNTGRPPFTYPKSAEDARHYRLHCEWTPIDEFREQVNEKFLPCIPRSRMKDHPNFGENLVSLGLYGSYCSDCNHSCHPEIHPYEWIWWLNLHPDQIAKANTKTWLLGLVVEGSNRFPNWSPAPRTGTIAIPFIFPAKSEILHIRLDHLVYGSFNADGFKELRGIPDNADELNWTQKEFKLEYPGGTPVKLEVQTNHAIQSDALKIWFDELNYDPAKDLIYGKLYLATSVDELYTGRITFSFIAPSLPPHH